jgi:hypothetical protein
MRTGERVLSELARKGGDAEAMTHAQARAAG